MSREAETEIQRVRAFRREVVCERNRTPCGYLLLHSLWTAAVMTMGLWSLLMVMFTAIQVSFVLANGMGNPVAALHGVILSFGIFGGFTAVFIGVIAVPTAIGLAIFKPRPKLICAGRGKLVVWYRRKKVVVPLAECHWKPGRIWSMDTPGALFRWQPFHVLTWTPSPSADGSVEQPLIFFAGLTPLKYRQWSGLFEREQILRSNAKIPLILINGAIIGGFVGGLIGIVAGTVARLAWNPLAGACVVFLCLMDGLLMGAIARYVSSAELRLVQAFLSRMGSFTSLVMAMIFALLAIKTFRGTGLEKVAVAAVINGLIGFLFGWTMQNICEKREKLEGSIHLSQPGESGSLVG